MANTDGGVLLIGVDNEGMITGLEKPDDESLSDKFIRKFLQTKILAPKEWKEGRAKDDVLEHNATYSMTDLKKQTMKNFSNLNDVRFFSTVNDKIIMAIFVKPVHDKIVLLKKAHPSKRQPTSHDILFYREKNSGEIRSIIDIDASDTSMIEELNRRSPPTPPKAYKELAESYKGKLKITNSEDRPLKFSYPP